MDRHEQCDRDAEPQDPTARREQRHVHVVEHEDLVAQYRKPIEVLGPLVMLDGCDGGLEPGYMGLEGDGHPLAEAALRAVADDVQEPARRSRSTQPDGRHHDESSVCLEHAVCKELEPQRQQRVRQCGEERQAEGHGEQ